MMMTKTKMTKGMVMVRSDTINKEMHRHLDGRISSQMTEVCSLILRSQVTDAIVMRIKR